MNRKLTPIASAVALLLMGASMSAQAQQAATTPAPAATEPAVETVTVTGIRGALQQSLNQKRNAESHVEVITAEDIGKMPDKNVADSLARVPGVTISSAGGTEGGFDEADRVSMRGTNPSLTNVTINGHGVASGDWFVLDQSGTVGRSVSFTLIPSEVVGSVVVHKSSEANQIEGGVAGSVDIITRKPLDFKKQFTAEATIGAVYADLPGTTDPQFSGLINWKNDAKTFGLLLQVFDEVRHEERDGQELLTWESILPGSPIALAHPNLAGVAYPQDIGSTLFTQERKRRGGEFDAQFKVNNDLSFDINGFDSNMIATNYNRNYILWLHNILQQGAGTSPTTYTVQNNILTAATFPGSSSITPGVYDMISRPDASESSRYIAIDGKLRVNQDLKFSAQAGASAGDGKSPVQNISELNIGTGQASGMAMNSLYTPTSWYIGNNNASSPQSTNSSFGWVFGDQNTDVKDTENWAQIDGEWSVASGIFTTLQFGLRYNDHARSSQDVIGQGPSAYQQNAANIPSSGFSNYPSGFGSGLGGGSYPTNVFYFTPAQLAAYDNSSNANQYLPQCDPANITVQCSRQHWSQDFLVQESDSAGYIQSNFEGNGWSGNVGVRFVETKEHVIANVAATPTTPGANNGSLFGAYVPTVFDNTYTNLLPSFNLKYDLSKDLVARFAVSKTMARPDYSALSGSVSLNAPPALGQLGNGTGGNPNLAPIISNNIDGSIEWYFAPHAMLSASLFEMDLTSYVGYGSVIQTYQSVGGGLGSAPIGTLGQYDMTVPINISANVKGVELALQEPIGKNFGVGANYTYITAADSMGDPVVGASRDTGNLSGYYEDNKFNARLGYTVRSSFFSGLDRSTAFFQATTATVNATLGYKFSDQLAFTLDGMNLNNPLLKYYGAAGPIQPERFYTNGRQYYLNAHLKY
jgi:iron complex outermembrane receptor protein